MPIYINRTNAGKNQMPQAGFEPTTPRSHDNQCSFVANIRLTPLWLPR